MKRVSRLVAVAGLAAGALAVQASLAAAEKWDMPLAYSATNYHSKNATAFAEAVTKRTKGAITIKTHPSGSLFKGGAIFRAVRTGQVPIGERLISALGNEDPIFEIDALPFLATSFADAKKLHKASKPYLEKVLAKKRLKLLYAVPWPPQGLYANKPVMTVADMKGLKFRAYNAATARLASLMGAVPTKIEAAELSQAFATGVAQSMISSGSTGYDRKIWEHVKFWYDVQAWLPKNMVIINARVWKKLEPEHQKILMDTAAEYEAKGWAEAERLANWYKEQLAKNGMKVGPPSADLKKGFQEIGATMTEEWLKKAGDNGKAALEAYKKM